MIMRIRNSSLRAKLIMFVVLLVVASTTSIGWVFFLVLKRAIVNEVGQSIQEVLRQTMQNVDYKLSDIDTLYQSLISSREMQEMMEAPPMDAATAANYTKTYYDIVYPNVFGGRSEQLLSVSLFGENGLNLLSSTSMYTASRTKADIEKTRLYRIAEQGRGKPVWLFTNQDFFSTEEAAPKSIANVRKALGLLTFKDWGLLVINVKESYLYDSYRNILSDMKAITFLVDDHGLIVSHADKRLVSTPVDAELWAQIEGRTNGSLLTQVGDAPFSAHFITSGYTGWKLVTLLPQSAINKNIELAKGTIITIVLITVVIAVIVSVVLSSTITRPLQKLLRHMTKVRDGAIHTKVQLGTQEEFGQLSERFNEMTDEILALVEKTRTDEKELREAEFRALQSQINPHLLYNTLDSIYWMTKTKEVDGIAELTLSLARFFRLVLNKGSELTTIASELQTVRHYVAIQQRLYKDKFDCEIDADEAALAQPCLKLMLQPLVENAILHGLKPLRQRRGLLRIRVTRTAHLLLLEVRDNGVGMEPDQLAGLLSPPMDGEGGFGMYNVNERIRLAYGPAFGLRCESEPGQGTCILITIPEGTDEHERNGETG